MFIFRHPKTVDSTKVFTAPFVWIVWLLIFLTGIITAFVTRNFFLIENRLSAQFLNVRTSSNDDTYYNSVLMVVGILFQQGNDSVTFHSKKKFQKFDWPLPLVSNRNCRQSIIFLDARFHIDLSNVFRDRLSILW